MGVFKMVTTMSDSQKVATEYIDSVYNNLKEKHGHESEFL